MGETCGTYGREVSTKFEWKYLKEGTTWEIWA